MTLNQIARELKRIVSRHKQISTYYLGEITEWACFEGLTYPSCLISLDKATLAERQATFEFTLYIADLLNETGNNRTDVHSDTLQVLQDLLSALGDEGIDWMLEKDAAGVTFFDDERGNEHNPDRVGGVRTSFSIRVDFIRDRCIVPARKPIMTEEGFTIFTEDNKPLEMEDQQAQ